MIIVITTIILLSICTIDSNNAVTILTILSFSFSTIPIIKIITSNITFVVNIAGEEVDVAWMMTVKVIEGGIFNYNSTDIDNNGICDDENVDEDEYVDNNDNYDGNNNNDNDQDDGNDNHDYNGKNY